MAPLSRFLTPSDLILDSASHLFSRRDAPPSPNQPSTPQPLTRRAPQDYSPKYHPGAGIRPPNAFNNKGMLALFALLGAAMVVSAIWFFFWAKNGGFVWRGKADWDDYKSTVLRRKDANGKTLSNATPHTDLGQKSIAGTFNYDREEMSEVKGGFDHGHGPRRSGARRKHHHRHASGHARREPSDEDVRAYRHERPAMVGGLNTFGDSSAFGGSHHDRPISDYYSDVDSYHDGGSNNSRVNLQPKPLPPKKKGILEKTKEKREQQKSLWENRKKAKATEKKSKVDKPARRTPEGRTRPAQRPLSDDGSTAADEYRRDGFYAGNYRPQAQPYAARPARNSPRHSHAGTPRQSSPLKRESKPPGSFDTYSDLESDTGTKSYTHHIPGLSKGSRDTGFRRGGTGGRRDSLSDSD